MGKTVTLTPMVIRYLADKPELREQFPFLKFAAYELGRKVKRSCCGKAKRKSGIAQIKVLETVRASIAHLPTDRLKIIKDALGADELIIILMVQGQRITHRK